MRKSSVLTLVLMLAMPALGWSQTIAEPFKVGTFEINGAPTVGIVLRDRLIVELEAANLALERNSAFPEIPLPADMLELIGRYDYGLQRRLYEIVNHLVAGDSLGDDRPDYVHKVGDVRTLPPIMYPGIILNAAVNFYSHVEEAGTEEERQEAKRLRREERGVPYLFIKPSRGAVVGNGVRSAAFLICLSNRAAARWLVMAPTSLFRMGAIEPTGKWSLALSLARRQSMFLQTTPKTMCSVTW